MRQFTTAQEHRGKKLVVASRRVTVTKAALSSAAVVDWWLSGPLARGSLIGLDRNGVVAPRQDVGMCGDDVRMFHHLGFEPAYEVEVDAEFPFGAELTSLDLASEGPGPATATSAAAPSRKAGEPTTAHAKPDDLWTIQSLHDHPTALTT
jgi:hypothetical protein